MRILVVGGVAAGAGAATKARRTDENAEVVIFEKGPYVSFANCGLPYYVGGSIPDRDDLILVSPELFKERFNIDVRLGCEVVSVDAENKTIHVNTPVGQSDEKYDKLILAMGGEPIKPPIPGIGLDGVYNVFTVPDAEQIVKMLSAGAKSAVVVGGGFIGIETAEGLAQRGIKTTLVEAQDQLLNNFDPEFSLPVEEELKHIGVKIVLGGAVKEIIAGENGRVAAVKVGRKKIKTDMVIMAVGVKPRLTLAKSAGVEIGKAGGIVVDAGMRTNIADIYAAGDIVESVHLVSHKKVRIPLAGSANKQGRIAGCNAAGGNMLFKGVLGTAIIKAGGLACGRTGLNEKECAAQGLDYDTTYLYTNSSATYYPGADSMIIKVVYEKITGRLLGAQVMGRKGVDKRIDVYSTALYGGMSVFDLENLDLAYAPPFASAKDPVIMSGMVASNAVRGVCKTVSPTKAPELAKQPDTVLLDVRTRGEYEAGALDGAVNLPVDELRDRLGELDKSKKYLIYCGVGYRAYLACRILMQKGFDVYNVSGGYWTSVMDLSE